MKTNRINHRIGMVITIAFVGCLLVGYAPATVQADDEETTSNSVVDSDRPRSPRIDFEVGYFTARRQMFRELYGSFLNYAVSHQRPISGRFDLSLRAEFIRLAENGPELKYWVGSLTPMLLYNLPPKSIFHPIVGAGIGLSHRRVILATVQTGYDDEWLGDVTITQKEWNVHTVLTAGFDAHISHRAVLGARAYFDYYPFGDPTVGDFGDTGGFHFVGRVGFKF